MASSLSEDIHTLMSEAGKMIEQFLDISDSDASAEKELHRPCPTSELLWSISGMQRRNFERVNNEVILVLTVFFFFVVQGSGMGEITHGRGRLPSTQRTRGREDQEAAGVP